jgi:uncharacterized protein Yka (UPF0111/DUF47 family)
MHTTFLTPLDREDIYCLVNKLDSILDMMEAASARLLLYKVKEAAPALKEQAEILTQAIGKIKTMIHALRDMKNAARSSRPAWRSTPGDAATWCTNRHGPPLRERARCPE